VALVVVKGVSLVSAVKSKQFFWITWNATDLFIDNWPKNEAWMMPLIREVEASALVQGALRRFTQWPRIEHLTVQLIGGHYQLA